MSKTIEIDSCVSCPQAGSNGIEPICTLKFIGNVLPKDMSIPHWCPLPDSKPYRPRVMGDQHGRSGLGG